jgi:hypothetical protein
VVTAVDLGNGPGVRCPVCFKHYPVQAAWLGRELNCPGVGCPARLKINPFIGGGRPRGRRIERIRATFNRLAWIGAIAAAIYAYKWMASYALGIFAFLVVRHAVAWGIPEVITDPNKIQRILFYALYPAICAAVVYYTYQWWDRMWLAVIVGLVVAVTFNGLASAVLPTWVYEEEQ